MTFLSQNKMQPTKNSFVRAAMLWPSGVCSCGLVLVGARSPVTIITVSPLAVVEHPSRMFPLISG